MNKEAGRIDLTRKSEKELREEEGLKFYKALFILLIILPFLLEIFEYVRTRHDPMNGTEEVVRVKLIERTPLGTSAREVSEILRGWSLVDLTDLVNSSLCVVDDLHPALFLEEKQAECLYVGRYYIRGSKMFGVYLEHEAFAYWVFDTDKKLIQIYVINVSGASGIGEIQ